MKFLAICALLISAYNCATLHDRTQMSDWNIIATAKNQTECVKSFENSKLDYCCLNSTVQVKNAQDTTGNYFIFSADNAVGTTNGCSKIKNIQGYSNGNPKSPQIVFRQGENNQIMQQITLIVSETTVVENGVTKYKFILQIPANVLTTSQDAKILQTIEYEEVVATPAPTVKQSS